MTTSDAPQPPGGPLREDQPDGPLAPAQGEDQGEGEGQREDQGEADRGLQEENAETSLDQPST